MVKVLIADDRSEVRSALRLLLEQQSAARVVGEAAAADELWERLDALTPQIVLLDWELPGLAPELQLALLHARCPRARVVVLSSLLGAGDAALAAGADAFVSKVEPPERLLAALRALAGEIGAAWERPWPEGESGGKHER
ncbi:MAG: response regulator transcription factor [Anaerolineae bacterium]|nr:response regulator transcription factor [Anaerolineae bacterium]